MFLTIPNMDKGYLLLSGELNFRDAKHNSTINCHFLKADVCKWLDANGWKLYCSQWIDQPMLAKEAPYPFACFTMRVAQDNCDIIAEAEVVSQQLLNVRGGYHTFVRPIIQVRGEDVISLHKELMLKAVQYIYEYADFAKQLLLTQLTQEETNENKQQALN